LGSPPEPVFTAREGELLPYELQILLMARGLEKIYRYAERRQRW